MSLSKEILSKYDVKLVDGWLPPSGEDLRPLIAMPNIPRPLHGVNPRTLLGASTWNHMRKFCYNQANDTCEICGCKPDNPHHRHGHEVYEIDYAKGTAKFVRVFCVCSLCHLACIHTGRALTLWKKQNPLYPTEFLLSGAEHAFKIISEYNRDNPKADLRAYSTFLDYLKHDELREPMEKLIKQYNIKFYTEIEDMVEWGDWKLLIGDQEYPTPYANKEAWKATMEEREAKDTARIMQKNMESQFTGGVYDEIKNIIGEATLSDVAKGTEEGNEAVRIAMELAAKDQQNVIEKTKEKQDGRPSENKGKNKDL